MYKHDIKKTWSVINETINRKPSNKTVNTFIINNEKVTDQTEIANSFNNYFVNIGKSLSEQIHTNCHFSDYLHNSTVTKFKFELVDDAKVENIIKKLKNKSSFGHDLISNKIIKMSSSVLIKTTHSIS